MLQGRRREIARWISEDLCVDAAKRCNLSCVFCHSPQRGSCSSRAKVLRQLKARDVRAVNLEGGGEPTLNPDFFGWLDFLRANGVERFTLSTNAVALADPAFCRRAEARIDFFVVNLPACDARTYRRLTRSSLFPRAVRGIENLVSLGAGPKVRLFHVVCKPNYRWLPEFAAWVAARFPEIAFTNLTFVRGLGRARGDAGILPTYREVSPFVKSALARLKEAGRKAVIQNMPLCALRGFEGFSYEFQRWRRGDSVLEHGLAAKARCPRCRGCGLEPACCGARPDYVSVHGDGDLRPSGRAPESLLPEGF
ncbi:MAG: radical SAM protein [Elusimicrobiota bacterium]